MDGFKLKTSKAYIAAGAAIVLALAANMTAYGLESEYNLRLDATREQYTVLSEGTNELLSSLKKDVYVYYIEGPEQQDVTYALLESYGTASGNVHFKAVDPESEDATVIGAPKYSVVVSDTNMLGAHPASAKARTAVLQGSDLYSDKHSGYSPANSVHYSGEQRITSAIAYVAQEKETRVVFLTGQDEKQPCESLLADISRMYYGAGFITAGAPLDPKYSILAVLSPMEDINEAGYENIKAFLKAGGHAVFMLGNLSVDETAGKADYPKDGLERFRLLLSDYGISVENGVITGGDPSKTYKSPTNIMPEVTEEGAEALGISGNALRPVLAYASPIEITAVEGTQAVPLLETDASCRVATAEYPVKLDDGSGAGEAFTAGAAVQSGETSLAVFTSSSFVTSEGDYAYKGNSDLFINTLKFLGGRQAAAPIPAKVVYDSDDPAYKLSVGSDTEKAALMTAAAGIPALTVFIIGLSRWVKRRKL